jgi:hypothetical protein
MRSERPKLGLRSRGTADRRLTDLGQPQCRCIPKLAGQRKRMARTPVGTIGAVTFVIATIGEAMFW